MPIYEYECAKCGHTLEIIQKINDAPLTECPACHEHSLRKLISAAAFQLKGTGWYVTDFKNKPKAATDSKKDTSPAADSNADKKDSKKESTTAKGDSGTPSVKKATSASD